MEQATEVIVIGAGQAGLSAAYYLAKHKVPYLVLDANDSIAAVWDSRWDSLQLFTKSAYNNLPGGLDFPEMEGYPGKDEVVQYLRDYVAHHQLQVQLNTFVGKVEKDSSGDFLLSSNQGTFRSKAVIVATGECQTPYTPACAAKLPDSVFQIHSRDYRRPDQIPPGEVLVVGTANSGVQIARELALKGRTVYLAGRENKSLPAKLAGKDIFWWLTKANVLDWSADHLIGRQMVTKGRHFGGLLIGYTLKDIVKGYGLKRLSKVVDYKGEELIFAEGERLRIPNVIWATGYKQDFSWIDLPIYNKSGELRQKRGVVKKVPGLYFSGLKLLHRVGSSLLGSGWKDSRHVVRHIRKKRSKSTQHFAHNASLYQPGHR